MADLIHPPARFVPLRSRRHSGRIARPLILTAGGEYPFRIRAGDSMATSQVRPQSIDEYIGAFSPEAQAILERIRLVIAKAAPEAQESLSCRIPTFTVSGALVYFAAFKKHIGLTEPKAAAKSKQGR